MPVKLLDAIPKKAVAHLILAHGAGAPMDSEFMEAITANLSARAVAVSRFEFAYMAERRKTASKRPPPRLDKLTVEYTAVVDYLMVNAQHGVPLLIGGKSMGGRIASMIAGAYHARNQVAGLVCLGYPFHPVGKPGTLRTSHLQALVCPTLIIQGTRDKLGDQSEVDGYDLPKCVSLVWLADGDHDFKPRKASGTTQAAHIDTAADAIAKFAAHL